MVVIVIFVNLPIKPNGINFNCKSCSKPAARPSLSCQEIGFFLDLKLYFFSYVPDIFSRFEHILYDYLHYIFLFDG
jgi:hypothetical protein